MFFDTISRCATMDESALFRELERTMRGRNLTQCKGHFRVLCQVGRVVLKTGPPKRWVVPEGVTGPAQMRSAGMEGAAGTEEEDETEEDARTDAEKEGADGEVSGESGKERVALPPRKQSARGRVDEDGNVTGFRHEREITVRKNGEAGENQSTGTPTFFARSATQPL